MSKSFQTEVDGWVIWLFEDEHCRRWQDLNCQPPDTEGNTLTTELKSQMKLKSCFLKNIYIFRQN